MERVLSQDERIRRAEEIYARRRMQTQARSSATVNVEENQEQRCCSGCKIHRSGLGRIPGAG